MPLLHVRAAGHPAIDPSVTDPHAIMEVRYGRTYHVWLMAPWPSKLAGPTLTITTVKIGFAPNDPQPPRVNAPRIPDDDPQPDPAVRPSMRPASSSDRSAHRLA